jgi:hypothetical protein
VTSSTAEVEMKLQGEGPWSLAPDIELIFNPGHTEVCRIQPPPTASCTITLQIRSRTRKVKCGNIAHVHLSSAAESNHSVFIEQFLLSAYELQDLKTRKKELFRPSGK